jgi:hypothetical protein
MILPGLTVDVSSVVSTYGAAVKSQLQQWPGQA